MSKILEARKQAYLEEMRGWKWDRIKSHCLNNTQEDRDNEQTVGSCLIGSLLDVPSGKFYTPFANSNVDPCPHCGGQGTMKNLNGDLFKNQELKALSKRLTRFLIVKYGSFQNWPDGSMAIRDIISLEAEQTKPQLDCPFCGGIGSEEAAWDELWHEALAEVADENGGWIDYQDDQFFCMVVDDPDPEDETIEGDLEPEIEEDDFIFADPGFTRNGKRVAETEQELRELMDQEQFWPNVWYVSDHGNVSLYTWDTQP